MTVTSTIDSLLVACHADPANDLPRLVLAEWLTDNGQEERAELIRVQIELAKPECTMQYVKTQELKRLTSRMSRLERGDPRWIHELEPQLHQAWVRYVDSRDDLRRREHELIRGGETDPEKYGKNFWVWTGQAVQAGFRRWGTGCGIDIVRGLLHVEAPLQTLCECLPRLGRELLWVGSVHCTDREAYEFLGSWSFMESADEDGLGPLNSLPVKVFGRLKGGSLYRYYGLWRDYNSRQAAFEDLAENGDLSSWILEKAWTEAQLSRPLTL